MRTALHLTSILLLGSITASCIESTDDNNYTAIEIPFMAHAGSTHLHCGVEMSQLGTTNETGYMKDFRFFVHDAILVDENDNEYPIILTTNNWQTENVTLLSFSDKENCVENSGASLETNMKIIGKYQSPQDAVITKLKFKVGVPATLNHENPTEAASPLNIPSMAWSWQSGYKHMRIEATINDTSFLFHLGSTGCVGDPAIGETVSCARHNRPEFLLENFDLNMNAVQFDFQSLVEHLDVSAGGSCHSSSGQAATCQGAFDSLGLDFYDGSGNTLEQANEGQTVFTTVMNHV